MSNGLNKVLIIGNLGADPDVKFTQAGSPVANLSVATTEKVRDKESAICSREIACKEGLFVGYTSGAVYRPPNNSVIENYLIKIVLLL